MKGVRIRHQVIFCLKSGTDSPETKRFLEDGRRILTAIPGVENFAVFRQVSSKNEYDFGFSMEFAGRVDYDRYSAHPAHTAFVSERWQPEVARFLEIDFEE